MAGRPPVSPALRLRALLPPRPPPAGSRARALRPAPRTTDRPASPLGPPAGAKRRVWVASGFGDGRLGGEGDGEGGAGRGAGWVEDEVAAHRPAELARHVE